jgi:Na+-driven multidrug efflux pump
VNAPKPKLTHGPVGKHLVDMTAPVLLGIATMMGQGLIDTWFIGQVGDAQLAAFGFGFPILMIVTSVAIGLGAGTSSVVARAIGADDHQRARRLSTDSLLLSFLVTAIISAIGIVTIGPLFRLLGAPDELMPLIRGFMIILYMGVPFIVVGMVGMASMRATGDTRLPSMLMILAAVLNVILDPILIFGVGPVPAMGLNGPDAVAGFGVASRIESMMLVMYYALSAIIGPFVGQNFSAGKEERILRALWLCTVFSIGSGLVIAGLLASMSGWLPGLFSDSESVRRVTSMFLWIVPISYGTYGMVMVMNASFNGLGYPMPGVVISVCRIAVLYIPIALVAMQFFDIAGIFAAYAIANIVSGLGAYAWARSAVRQRCAEDALLRQAAAEIRQ